MDIKGFAQMAIHSAHAAALLVLDERVGRHRDDGHRTRVVAVERANDAGRLVAVHLGHLDVHEDQVDGARVCFAQNKLFDKYADMDDVTSVYISKKMFQMMPVMETAGLNLANLKGKIESLQILTTQKADLRERMRGELKALIGKDHEELMRVKDGKTKANFYVKQQGELIQELIMIADMDDGGFSVMQLLGRFTLQDVQEITSEINK